jgi:hypothetical protein
MIAGWAKRSTAWQVTHSRAVRAVAAVLVLATVAGCDAFVSDRASSPETTGRSPTAAPASSGEAVGVGAVIAERIHSFVDPSTNAQLRPLRAVIIEVDGQTVLEDYYRGSSSDTSNVFSVTSSVVGTLIGIALSDGSLRSIDQNAG